jgi:ligand-binding sensor domain-containing protein
MKHVTTLLVAILVSISVFSHTTKDSLVESGYSYRRYTTQDGLPQMLSESLIQDDKGYIWVGTLSGFARYDGFMFKQFLREKSENIVSFGGLGRDTVLERSLRSNCLKAALVL